MDTSTATPSSVGAGVVRHCGGAAGHPLGATAPLRRCPREVWTAMTRTGAYRSWWPWLRRLDDASFTVGSRWACEVQPPLPYTVRFTLVLEEIEPGRFVTATITGDIVGSAAVDPRRRSPLPARAPAPTPTRRRPARRPPPAHDARFARPVAASATTGCGHRVPAVPPPGARRPRTGTRHQRIGAVAKRTCRRCGGTMIILEPYSPSSAHSPGRHPAGPGRRPHRRRARPQLRPHGRRSAPPVLLTPQHQGAGLAGRRPPALGHPDGAVGLGDDRGPVDRGAPGCGGRGRAGRGRGPASRSRPGPAPRPPRRPSRGVRGR